MYILITPAGDRWEYEELEDARRDQYIFGGRIVEERKAEK